MDDAHSDKGARTAEELDLLQRSSKKSKTNAFESGIGFVDVVMETLVDVQKVLGTTMNRSDLVALEAVATVCPHSKTSFRDYLIGVQYVGGLKMVYKRMLFLMMRIKVKKVMFSAL